MNKHFNKHLLTSLSALALMTASSNVYAASCTGACLTQASGTAAQIQADYNIALTSAMDTGFAPPEGWSKVSYDVVSAAVNPNGAASYTATNNAGVPLSATIYSTTSELAPLSNGQVISIFQHEMGHVANPDFQVVEQNNSDNTLIDLSGENAANVYGAWFGGQQSLQQGGTEAAGVQNFVNGYFDNVVGDPVHGTLSDQLMAIAEAYPDLTLSVPPTVVAEMEKDGDIPAADVPAGATFTVKGNTYTMHGGTAAQDQAAVSNGAASDAEDDDYAADEDAFGAADSTGGGFLDQWLGETMAMAGIDNGSADYADDGLFLDELDVEGEDMAESGLAYGSNSTYDALFFDATIIDLTDSGPGADGSDLDVDFQYVPI